MELPLTTGQSLHVGIDGTALYGVYGGVEYSLWNLLGALHALKSAHRFTVWIPADGPTESQLEPFGERWTWRRLPFRGEEKLRRIVWQQCQFSHALRRAKCDLLHAPTYVAPLRPGLPMVLGVYDVIALTHPEFATRANRSHYGFMLPRCLIRATHVIVPTDAVKRDVQRLVPGTHTHVSVVPLGVESAFFNPVSESAVRSVRERYNLPSEYLLFTGNFEPKKNLITLLKALDMAPEAPDLAIVGGGRAWVGHEPEAVFRAVPRSVRSRVKSVGYVRRLDLPAIFAGCRAFVFPSLAEGFCLPVAEALACGAPVITSDAVPLPNLESVALISAPRDPTTLAENIKKVLGEPALEQRLRELGREYARQFTWSRAARQTLDIYEAVGTDVRANN